MGVGVRVVRPVGVVLGVDVVLAGGVGVVVAVGVVLVVAVGVVVVVPLGVVVVVPLAVVVVLGTAMSAGSWGDSECTGVAEGFCCFRRGMASDGRLQGGRRESDRRGVPRG